MRSGNWDGLLPTGKTRQSTLSVSLNDISESRCPAYSGPLSDADTACPYRYCDVVRVDYKEYLLWGNETVFMSFIDWIAAMAKKKGRQKATRPIRITRTGSASTTPYINNIKWTAMSYNR
jgi:hypothetical protein